MQKEISHNEALALIDLLLGGSIEAGPIAAPPPSPVAGGLYRVAATGTSGAFVGHEGKLAGWTAGGWRFVAPVEGMRLTQRTPGTDLHYRDGEWRSGSLRAEEVVIGGAKVVGGQSAAIAGATGGTVVDAEARACLGLILGALRTHGLIAT